MNAVWTILGPWTAAAAAVGAGIAIVLLPWPSMRTWLLLTLMGSEAPLTSLSLSGLLVAEAGAEEFVGVIISMGSGSFGPDIWMVGVRMGTVRGAIGSSLTSPSPRCVLCGLSITCAICAWGDKTVSIWTRDSIQRPAGGDGWATGWVAWRGVLEAEEQGRGKLLD